MLSQDFQATPAIMKKAGKTFLEKARECGRSRVEACPGRLFLGRLCVVEFSSQHLNKLTEISLFLSV